MANYKYQFNPDTLSYEKVENNHRNRFFKLIFTQIAAALVIAFLLFLFTSNFIDSPTERRIKRENKKLEKQYKVLTERYELISKIVDDIEKRDENIYRAIFEAEPAYKKTQSVSDTSNIQKTNKNTQLLTYKTALKMQALERKIKKSHHNYDSLMQQVKAKEEMLSGLPSIQPVPNKDLKLLIYGYGMKIDPMYKTPAFHHGIDFAAPKGTPIFATADGTVKKVEHRARGYGKMVMIKHKHGYETLYAHMSKIEVRVGQKVKRGEKIAEVGNEGKSITSHLHYEVHKDGKDIDPIYFFFGELSPKQFNKVLEKSTWSGQVLD